MKLYLVVPVIAADTDKAADDARLRECAGHIADLIIRHVSADPALFGMRHVGEASEAPVPPDGRFGEVETVRIADTKTLGTVLRESGDPNSGKWMLVRSLVTCRAVSYGYDGQAFVCVPSDAEPIVSPDERLIAVQECSHLLAKTDWMDGLSAS